MRSLLVRARPLTTPGLARFAVVILGAIVGMGIAMSAVKTAQADYTLSTGPYYDYRVGSSAAVWADQGTVLDDNTGSPYLPGPEFWDWLAVQTLGSPMDKFSNTWTGCGNPSTCIVYQNHGGAVGGTSCDLPALGSGDAAVIYILAGVDGQNVGDPDCNGLGTPTSPVFVVSVNTTHFSWTANRIDHTRRHETAHALGLADTGTSCWTDTNNPFTGTWLYPLMRNGSANCGSYPANMLPTWNEIGAAQGWNAW